MIGEDAFCPKTGAPLSEDKHYDEQGRPQRAAVRDGLTAESQPTGELTNGAVRSSKTALFNHFRRCHRRHADPDDELYRKAALGLSRLKATGDGRQQWDVYVWYALQHRLDSAGFNVEWMHVHADPRCPHCHGQLTYTLYDNGEVTAQCATNCTGDTTNHLSPIRDIVASLYTSAFDAAVDPEDLLQFEQGELS